MKIPLNPEVRKAQKLMDQSPLPLTVRIRISLCFGDLAVTYADKTFQLVNSQRKSHAGEVGVLSSLKKIKNLKNPL